MWEILDCCTPCRLDHISRRPSAFGQERDKKQSFEMRIAKTFLSMTSAFTLALFPSIVSVVMSALTFDQTYPPLPDYSMKLTKFLVSFDFVGAFCVLANSFHNCIIYTVRSPRFKRNLKEILSSCCVLCETKLKNLRRSSLWSMLSVDKRKSFSSVTVTSRVHPSVEHSENKLPSSRVSPIDKEDNVAVE